MMPRVCGRLTLLRSGLFMELRLRAVRVAALQVATTTSLRAATQAAGGQAGGQAGSAVVGFQLDWSLYSL